MTALPLISHHAPCSPRSACTGRSVLLLRQAGRPTYSEIPAHAGMARDRSSIVIGLVMHIGRAFARSAGASASRLMRFVSVSSLNSGSRGSLPPALSRINDAGRVTLTGALRGERGRFARRVSFLKLSFSPKAMLRSLVRARINGMGTSSWHDKTIVAGQQKWMRQQP